MATSLAHSPPAANLTAAQVWLLGDSSLTSPAAYAAAKAIRRRERLAAARHSASLRAAKATGATAEAWRSLASEPSPSRASLRAALAAAEASKAYYGYGLDAIAAIAAAAGAADIAAEARQASARAFAADAIAGADAMARRGNIGEALRWLRHIRREYSAEPSLADAEARIRRQLLKLA